MAAGSASPRAFRWPGTGHDDSCPDRRRPVDGPGRLPAQCGCATVAVVMWRVGDFPADDLDAAVRLWEDPASSSEAPLFGLSDLIAAVRSHQPAVVAVVGVELPGVAVATVTGDQAWVMRISLAAAWRRRGVGSALLG